MSHMQANHEAVSRDLPDLPLKEWDVLKEMITSSKLCLITRKM